MNWPLKPRPGAGGHHTRTDRRDGADVDHTGEYLEIERPRRLVFTFRVPKYSSLTTRVTIEITPLEHGCELTLSNEDVPPEWQEPAIAGWTSILAALAGIA
jgi:uncharacterized protein YndB with AHSA1/START domain